MSHVYFFYIATILITPNGSLKEVNPPANTKTSNWFQSCFFSFRVNKQDKMNTKKNIRT